MSLGKHLLRGSGANLIDLMVKTAAVFVTTPLLLHSLGVEGYGSWILIMSVIGYFQLVDMGMTFSTTRFIAIAVGAGDESRQALLMETMLRFFRLAALIVLLLTWIANFILPILLPDGQFSDDLILVFVICSSAIALRLFCRSALVLLRAHVRYDLQAWASILRTAVQTPILYWALIKGYGLLGAAASQALGECIELGAQRLFSSSLSRPKSVPISFESIRQVRRELFVYSRSIVMGGIGDSMRLQINPFLIARLRGVDVVPVYSIGLRLITILQDVVNAIFGGQLLAVFSQLHGGNETGRLREVFLKVSQITSGFSSVAMLGAVWIARPFLERWVGANMGQAYEVMQILAIPFALHFTQFPAYNLLYTLGKTHWIVQMLLIGGGVSLLLGFLLGLNWGVSGIVYGAAAVMFIERGLLMPIFVKYCTGVPLHSYMINSMFWPAVKAMLFPAVYIWTVSPFLLPDYGRLIIIAIGYGFVFLLSFPFMIFDMNTRSLLMSQVRNLGKR